MAVERHQRFCSITGHPRLWRAVSVVVLSCLVSGKVPPPVRASTTGDHLGTRLRSSPAVQELLELTADIARRAAVADPVQLRTTAETRDLAAAAQALGLSWIEAEEIAGRMEWLRESILLEFSELRQIGQHALAGSCVASGSCDPHEAIGGTKEVAATLEGLLAAWGQTEGQALDGSGCHWVQ